MQNKIFQEILKSRSKSPIRRLNRPSTSNTYYNKEIIKEQHYKRTIKLIFIDGLLSKQYQLLHLFHLLKQYKETTQNKYIILQKLIENKRKTKYYSIWKKAVNQLNKSYQQIQKGQINKSSPRLKQNSQQLSLQLNRSIQNQ